MWKRSRAKA
jgi:hypothetical protein